jgi:hypothetical protein
MRRTAAPGSATPAPSGCSPASRRTRPRPSSTANQLTGGIQGTARQPAGNASSSASTSSTYDQEQARIAERAAPARPEHRAAPRDLRHRRRRDRAQQPAHARRLPRQYYRDVLGANLGEADKQYATTSRQSRQNLARVGQLGSGLDASAQSGTLSDYLRARQQAVLDAAQQRDRLNANLTGQRLNFEQQIQGGGLANPDFGGIAGAAHATLEQARQQIAPAEIGHLFTVAGQGYQQGRIQEAQGNQGLQAFGFGRQRRRGSITVMSPSSAPA